MTVESSRLTIVSLLGLLCNLAAAQQPGSLQVETHPELNLQECTATGCTSRHGSIVLDANWRWVNKGGQNCYTNQNT